MKRSVILLLLAIATAASAQVPLTNLIPVRPQAPTYSDVYCAGFVSNQGLQKAGFVVGGWDTPHETRYVDGGYVYLQGGGFAVGTKYSVVREVKDLNRYETYHGQNALLHQLGHAYADIGRVKVIAVHDNIAITQVEFSCEDMIPGDAAIAFVERPIPTLRSKANFDPFAPPNGKLVGKVAMTKDFEAMAGMGQKVYLNVGANQGVKVGDYFRAVRYYGSYKNDEVDYLSLKATYYDDNQVPAGRFSDSRIGDLPRISLGEMMVLSVTPTSSTAMVTLSLEDIHLGDGAELEDVPPQASEDETQPAAPPQESLQQAAPHATPQAEPQAEPEAAQTATEQAPAAAPQPPVIACTAEPPSVHAGESSTISCEASSPDHRPLTFSFKAPNVRLVQRENTAVLDTREMAPGSVEVAATVTDDRDLAAIAKTTVNVDAPRAAVMPIKLSSVSFQSNSARLDNSGKAVLDGVALRLQRDSDSSLVLLGLVESGENRGLAQQRAASAAQYLTQEKGIDEKRLQLRDGGEFGDQAELWMVPAGAKLQEADLKH